MLLAEQEERKQRDEEEKRKRIEAHREKKRLEKQVSSMFLMQAKILEIYKVKYCFDFVLG